MINKLMWFFAFAFTLFACVGCTTQQKESSEFKVQDSESAERIQKLIKQLDDNDQKVRENATNELILIGKPAVPYVEKALSIRDAEVVWRAKGILNVLGVKFSD